MNSNLTPYNARHAAAKDIAASFVVPERFIDISRFTNTLLIGPRGSGKTTILKALTPSGLFHLAKRSDLRSKLADLKVNYLPVYIPAEASWKGDANTIKSAVPTKVDQDRILNGLFVDHTLRWVVLALQEAQRVSIDFTDNDNADWCLPINSENEEAFCRALSDVFQLKRVQTSFLGLKLALINRSNIYLSPITTRSHEALTEALQLPTLDILQMLRGVIEVISEKFPDTRWSFNFDEMEIAPRHVVSMLYENLRSWDQRAVLKFSLYPYVDFYSLEEKSNASERGPVDGPDFQTILLTNDFTKQRSQFSTDLVEAICKERGRSAQELAAYLNRSKAIQRDSRIFDGLETRRNFEQIFGNVFSSKTDTKLIRFLNDRGFQSRDELTSLRGENARAQSIRKIAPLCEFRNYYLTEHRKARKRSIRRTSPKGFGYYHGYGQVLALTEGNPRLIKFYINDLIDSLDKKEVSSIAQNRAIRRNVDRFCALVASQVVPDAGDTNNIENPLSFATRLGRVFASEVLGDEFKPEPMLSVAFKGIPPQLKRIIEVAINAGALVVDNSDNSSKLVFDVEGKRMRLSHSFAPRHPLPTITGQPMVLSEIPSIRPHFEDQTDLFGWSE